MAYLRGFVPEQHSSSSGETLQRWRAVGDAASDLMGPEIECQTFCADCDVINQYASMFFILWLFLGSALVFLLQ